MKAQDRYSNMHFVNCLREFLGLTPIEEITQTQNRAELARRARKALRRKLRDQARKNGGK